MDILSLIISLISGAIGGNAAGSAFKQNNLGPLVNTISGLIGGVGGEYLLKAYGILSSVATETAGNADIAQAVSNFDFTQIIATIGTSGVSGAALLAVVTLIKNALSK